MLLTWKLLPLLNQSPSPRVLSVLNGGKEGRMRHDDLHLVQHWSPLAVVGHSTTMTSLAFEYLAKHNRNICFLHVYPGWVRTENFARLSEKASGLVWNTVVMLVRGLVGVLARLFGMSSNDCGQRQAFHLASSAFKPGSWQLTHLSEQAPINDVLKYYKDNYWDEKIWELTVSTFEKVLGDKFA